jgi:acyl-coenzyme A thioesterase PaaI-like protein
MTDFREIPVPFHHYLGFELEVDGSPSRLVMQLGEHVRGAVAPLHGGVLCTLLDIACGAAVGGNDDYDATTTLPVSTRLDVHFVGQPRSGPLVATAQITERTPEGITVSGEVADGGGYVIGRATGTYRLITGFVSHGKA